MISGEFGDIGQLFFEIELIPASGEIFPIEVMLDTGFTTGWLAINTQDVETLEWYAVERRRAMQTARGEEYLDIYAGKVLFDPEEFDIPVVAGSELPENLIGLEWLKTRRLVVNFPSGWLTLG